LTDNEIPDYFELTYAILPENGISLEPPCKLSKVSWITGAEIHYSTNCFEIYGNDVAMRTILELLQAGEISFYRELPSQVRIRCELARELREFIAGKKNGKLNKIMKVTDTNITFENLGSEYTFMIDISSPGIREIRNGFKDLLEEFPAEIRWFVPEEYHKRIIGVQGRSIQRIMRFYNAYVKFFNALELAAAGGDDLVKENVLARTPSKNAYQLPLVKKAVEDMVFENVSPFETVLIS